MMDLELHQLDLRYQELRTRHPGRERRLLASLAEIGQQAPVIVVASEASRYVLVDGYKRVRALGRLHCDLVRATSWEVGEADALILERLLRSAESDTALEQGWLLRELQVRFGLSGEELSRRFDKSPSWVSVRLGLVRDLPGEIQALVVRGAVGAHGAMKSLVPFARANRDDCVRFAQAIAPLSLSSRQVGALYAAYQGGEAETRALVVRDPALVLRAQDEAKRRRDDQDSTPAGRLLGDFAILGSVARRAHPRLRRDAQQLSTAARAELWRCAAAAWVDLAALWRCVEKELSDAAPTSAKDDPGSPA